MAEIKSSLLNSSDLKYVKNSLLKVSEIDHQEDFRVRMIEYINDSCDNDGDRYFYDMIEFMRFLNPDDDAIAYTTPEHLIYMNAPNKKVKNMRQWDFTFDHECLHQLWDTFGVADKIKQKHGSYNHDILNIASDCVINDYLVHYRKKEIPDNLITPEYLHSQYHVDYDRKKDTQYTLYMKLWEIEKQNQELFDKLMQDPIIKKILDDMKKDQQQNNNSGSRQNKSGGSGGSSSSGGSDSNQGGDSSDETKDLNGKQAAEKAEKAAKDAEKKLEDAKKEGKLSKEELDKAEKAVKEAKKLAKEAKDAADKGDDDKAKGLAKDSLDKSKEADSALNQNKGNKQEGDGKDGDKDGEGDGDNNSKPSWGKGNGGENITDEIDLEKLKKSAEAIIDKYKNKISGDIGNFLNQCRLSVDCKDSGLSVTTFKGMASWNQDLHKYVNAYIKKRVFQKKREYEPTYSRLKRGSGYVKWGEMVEPGRRVKMQKMTINAAFYVDRSSSMGNCIKQVFKACYVIAEALKKQFSHEKVVDAVTFKVTAFDDYFTDVKYGETLNARGGTMSFDSILKRIEQKTNDYLINIIITDAGFHVDKRAVEDLLKKINGILLFVTNVKSDEVEKIAKENPTKLYYILADSNFTVK